MVRFQYSIEGLVTLTRMCGNRNKATTFLQLCGGSEKAIHEIKESFNQSGPASHSRKRGRFFIFIPQHLSCSQVTPFVSISCVVSSKVVARSTLPKQNLQSNPPQNLSQPSECALEHVSEVPYTFALTLTLQHR